LIQLKEFCGHNFSKWYHVYSLDKKKWIHGEVVKFSYSLVIDQKITYIEYDTNDALAFEKEMLEDQIQYFVTVYKDGKIKKVQPITFQEYINAIQDNVIPELKEVGEE